MSSLLTPNSLQAMKDDKKTCSYHENSASYHQNSSLYFISEVDQKVNLFIYDTEDEKEEVKIIEIRGEWENRFSLAQLPNGELFCISSLLAFKIDRNYEVKLLPSEELLFVSSVIYFNRSVYCFGGLNNNWNILKISMRFDLDENRWIMLASMSIADYSCTCTLFNGTILIAGCTSKNLLIYSIDIDSFSTIPYEFAENKQKIVIKAERLYLIECYKGGTIYESETGDEYAWQQIGKSEINEFCNQFYYLYNEEAIYISAIESWCSREYYKFDLNQKAFFETGYYCKHTAIRKKGSIIETIKDDNQTFKFDPVYTSIYNNKRLSLIYLGKRLEKIECCGKAIKLDPDNAQHYYNKGCTLHELGQNLEAVECHNLAIKLEPGHVGAYMDKGSALSDLGRNLEAIESYNEAIKFNPYFALAYHNKGNALAELENYLEAIECYDEAIKLQPTYAIAYNSKGEALNALGRFFEAIECYSEAVKINPRNSLAYSNKGEALNALGRNLEAIECYTESIRLDPNNIFPYIYEGNTLYALGRNLEAIECYIVKTPVLILIRYLCSLQYILFGYSCSVR